jgi:hypothetical protein
MEKINDQTAEGVKLILKTLISETMAIEDKDARMTMLPHIIEGIDLFELKR